MDTLGGLSPRLRECLTMLLRSSSGTITAPQAAAILGITSLKAAKLLSKLASHGWLSRVRRGLYVPVPLESHDPNPAIEDPWLVAEHAFKPCYIGGWSAAEQWNLTEQIFQTTIVLSIRRQRHTTQDLRGSLFKIKTVRPDSMSFGLQTIWRGPYKVTVSDASRTVIDILDDPMIGGGIRTVADILNEYLHSEHRNIPVLLSYAEKMGNGAVFKRLGYLLEQRNPNEKETIESCRLLKTKGLARLDSSLPQDHLVTAWNLWVPESWMNVECGL